MRNFERLLFLTTKDPRAEPTLADHTGSLVERNVASQPPTTESPAPVGSTVSDSAKAGIRNIRPSLSARREPLLPIVMIRCCGPSLCSRLVAESVPSVDVCALASLALAFTRSNDWSRLRNPLGRN